MSAQSNPWKPVLMIALAALAFMTVAIGSAVASSFHLIDGLTARRIGSIGIGIVVIVAGNFVPKMRLFEKQGYPIRRALAVQRFSGWVLVLSGLAIVALAILPNAQWIMLACSIVGLGAFALFGAAWAWLVLGPREAPPAMEDQAGDTLMRAAARQALLYILLGLFWAFAMFFAAYVWGSPVATWMSVAFSVMIALLAPLTRPKLAK